MGVKAKRISSNMEDYLEAIAFLKREKGIARVSDIGRLLQVKKPSVNAALITLAKDNLILHERYGSADLTKEGQRLAGDVQRRHDTVFKFLSRILEIDEKTAQADACKIEHAISPMTFGRLTKFIQFVEVGLDGGNPQWLKSLKHYLKTGKKLNCRMRQVALKKNKE
ncbi:MAG: metal-dependent transcriptional regulator [Candidatus Omnitrophica bacterium]|nr:metal-dependent transcriptional regulator [Candidatus Omnitrophota bacterium]